ncbi:hypothetical protein [Baaleninema sp.]|uniref:hypothetical protein n=1 Tax=Baaleninema sp. TaxID=3101197 RepID=UPI003CFDCEA7
MSENGVRPVELTDIQELLRSLPPDQRSQILAEELHELPPELRSKVLETEARRYGLSVVFGCNTINSSINIQIGLQGSELISTIEQLPKEQLGELLRAIANVVASKS